MVSCAWEGHGSRALFPLGLSLGMAARARFGAGAHRGEFTVNTLHDRPTSESRRWRSGATGEFVIVLDERAHLPIILLQFPPVCNPPQDGSSGGIFARRYDAGGVAVPAPTSR